MIVSPFTNAPIDTIKTRLQKTPAEEGQTAIQRIRLIATDMFKQEGPKAFYKGITPRVMRVAPGQAGKQQPFAPFQRMTHILICVPIVTFTVYEYIKGWMEKAKEVPGSGDYQES